MRIILGLGDLGESLSTADRPNISIITAERRFASLVRCLNTAKSIAKETAGGTASPKCRTEHFFKIDIFAKRRLLYQSETLIKDRHESNKETNILPKKTIIKSKSLQKFTMSRSAKEWSNAQNALAYLNVLITYHIAQRGISSNRSHSSNCKPNFRSGNRRWTIN